MEVASTGMRIEKTEFGTTPEGERVAEFTLEGGPGIVAKLIEYGATLTSLEAPDREGRIGPVVLGFDALEPYLDCGAYLGSTVGRFANRISGGRFALKGQTYHLTRNEGRHHLHGGGRGFDQALWRGEAIEAGDEVGVRFRHRSPDGEEGYPGELEVSVSYRLDRSGDLRIDYRATTDRATVVNLAHHSYFNLNSGGATSILSHEVQIEADRYLEIDEDGIPTGELRDVEGTPLDFRSPRAFGSRIDDLVASRGGYDHTFALRSRRAAPTLAARVTDAETGRGLEVLTTQPGLQLYSGNFLDGSLIGRGGVPYHRWHAFCLEAQHFPDTPNHPSFPSAVLEPGEVYAHSVVYRPGVRM
jgi:aldose 1-epimerase